MEDNNWLTSKEAKEVGKLKDCDLMHHRLGGKLKFKKRGNGFLYEKGDIIRIKDRT